MLYRGSDLAEGVFRIMDISVFSAPLHQAGFIGQFFALHIIQFQAADLALPFLIAIADRRLFGCIFQECFRVLSHCLVPYTQFYFACCNTNRINNVLSLR
ncbi:hypothetical protein D3C86_1156640 [compost metagenome]